jgi:hypothetical protein
MLGSYRVGLLLGLAFIGASPGFCSPESRVQITAPAPWLDSLERPDFAAPTSADAKQGFDVLLSEDQFSVGDQARYTHLTYRITSALGVQNGSNVTVTYDPEYESIDFHRLRIVGDGQVMDRLDALFVCRGRQNNFSDCDCRGHLDSAHPDFETREGHFRELSGYR